MPLISKCQQKLKLKSILVKHEVASAEGESNLSVKIWKNRHSLRLSPSEFLIVNSVFLH